MVSNLADEMRKAARLRGDTYSSMEIWGLLGRGAAEIERLQELLRGMGEGFLAPRPKTPVGKDAGKGALPDDLYCRR